MTGSRAPGKPPQDRDPRALIPHRPPILCIDELLGLGESEATATRVVREDSTSGGELWEPWLIEGLAQTAAALNGHNQDETESSPTDRKGMLVGVKHLKIHRRPTAGETITFQVRLIKRLGPVTLIEGEARVDEALIARGEMKFYVETE